MNPNIGALAAVGGHIKAAQVAAAQREAVQTVIEEWGGWPLLDSVENAQRRLDMLCRLSAERYVDGAAAGAAVRACEQWLRAENVRQDRQRMKELETQVRTLRAELREARRGRSPVPSED